MMRQPQGDTARGIKRALDRILDRTRGPRQQCEACENGIVRGKPRLAHNACPECLGTGFVRRPPEARQG